MKKRTQKDNFDIMLWAMICDCGDNKKYRDFKYALAHASDVLHGTTEFKPPKKGKKK